MSKSPIKTVSVKLPHHSYKIIIGDGVISEAGERIKKLFPDSRVAIITDMRVDIIHGDTLRKNLKKAGITYETIVVKGGEQSKSWSELKYVVEKLLSYSFERNDIVVGFGGGVVGDLAGFAAGIALRGMNFVQIPTTLLAQVDSAVGGKTGINGTKGKNLVGLFNHPSLVLSDILLLESLTRREKNAGYAEVLKYALIYDKKFFEWLVRYWRHIVEYSKELDNAIAKACKYKAKIVNDDEREKGKRALLNLGHTFGHALEAVAKYDSKKLVHGEAVAVGLVLAHQFSAKLGLCPEKDVKKIIEHLIHVGLPTRLSDIKKVKYGIGPLMSAIKKDKKIKKGKLTFILSKGIGKAFIEKDVPETKVREFLKECLKEG